MVKTTYHGYGDAAKSAAIHLLWTVRGELNSTSTLYEQIVDDVIRYDIMIGKDIKAVDCRLLKTDSKIIYIATMSIL